jgi:acyl dehydratase
MGPQGGMNSNDGDSYLSPHGTLNASTFPVPIDQRYLENYVAGSVYEFGPLLVSEEDILRFSALYGSRQCHQAPEAAPDAFSGGPVAECMLTAALCMRLLAEYYISSVACLGSPGADRVRWFEPVRPGDALSLRVRVISTRRSRSKPDRGILTSFVKVLNQRRELVMSREAMSIILCRDAQ